MKRTVKKKSETNNMWLIIIIVVVGLGVISVIIAAIAMMSMNFESPINLGGQKVAIIPINGFITSTESSGWGATGFSLQDTIDNIEQAANDQSIVGILIDIDSPGGEVYASSLVADALNKVNKTKLSVIRSVGASGGYWIALHTDYIFAHKHSITGSVGVISSYPQFDEFLTRYNVTYNRLVSGDYKDIGDPFVDLTDEKKAILMEQINLIYVDFVDLVRERRSLTPKQEKIVTTGQFFVGSRALELGLIDALVSDDEVEEYLMNELNVTSISFIQYTKDPSFFDLLSAEASHISYNLGRGISSGLFQSRTPIITS